MIWGDFRDVKLSAIIAPGDLTERMKAPHVVELAESTKRLGGKPGNVMWVMRAPKGWRLVAGRDRYTADVINGVKVDTVRCINEATEVELLDLEIEENLKRRPGDRAALIADHVARRAAAIAADRKRAEIADKASGKSPPAKAGRPLTPKGEARVAVAKAAGKTVEAVRKDEQRTAAKDRDEGPQENHGAGGSAAPAAPPIECYGHELPKFVADDVTNALAGLRKIDTLLRQATQVAASLPIGKAADVLRDELQALAARARAEAPAFLCPACHGKHVKGESCPLCNVRGWVTAIVHAAALETARRVTVEEYAAGLDAPAKTPGEAMALARAEDAGRFEVGPVVTVPMPTGAVEGAFDGADMIVTAVDRVAGAVTIETRVAGQAVALADALPKKKPRREIKLTLGGAPPVRLSEVDPEMLAPAPAVEAIDPAEDFEPEPDDEIGIDL